MKREYFGMIFFVVFVAAIFVCNYFFGEEIVADKLSRFIVVWVLIGFSVGQYSMKFPKSF
jgi:hypothetical protein